MGIEKKKTETNETRKKTSVRGKTREKKQQTNDWHALGRL